MTSARQERATASQQPPRPSPARRRFGFLAAAYAFTATMLGTTLPTPLYPAYQTRFGFSELTITIIFATYAGGVIAALVLFGRLSDEVGRRIVLLGGLGLSAASAVAFLAANGLAVLLVGRAISGLSAGIFTGAATAALVDLAPEEERGRATLVATAVNMGGLGLGPLTAGMLAQWAPAPLRLSYAVDLGLVAVAVLAVWAMPEPLSRRSRPRLALQSLTVPDDMRGVFVRAALVGFAGFAVLGLNSSVSPAFLGRVMDIHAPAAIGAVAFTAFATSTLGQLAMERVPRPAAMPVGCGLLIAAMALLAVGLALGSLAALVAAVAVAGFGQGLSFRAALGELSERAPERVRGEVASSFFLVAYVALAVPVIGEGLLAQLAGLRAAGLIFAGVVAAMALCVLVLLRRRVQQREEKEPPCCS